MNSSVKKLAERGDKIFNFKEFSSAITSSNTALRAVPKRALEETKTLRYLEESIAERLESGNYNLE